MRGVTEARWGNNGNMQIRALFKPCRNIQHFRYNYITSVSLSSKSIFKHWAIEYETYNFIQMLIFLKYGLTYHPPHMISPFLTMSVFFFQDRNQSSLRVLSRQVFLSRTCNLPSSYTPPQMLLIWKCCYVQCILAHREIISKNICAFSGLGGINNLSYNINV